MFLAEKNEKDLERRYAAGIGTVRESFLSGVFEITVDEGQVDICAAFDPACKKKGEKPCNIGTVGSDSVAGQTSLREKVPVEFLMEMGEMFAQCWCVRFLFQRRLVVVAEDREQCSAAGEHCRLHQDTRLGRCRARLL